MKAKRGKSQIDYKVFLAYFLSYIAVLFLLFLAIGGYSYYSIVTEKMVVAKEDIGSYIRNKADGLNEKAGAALNVSMAFYRNREVSKIRNLSREFKPAEYFLFQSLQTSLKFLTTSGYIDRISLYFHENELLVASDIIDDRPWVYYDSWPFPLPQTYAAFREKVTHEKPGSFSVMETRGDIVTLAYTLPFSDNTKGVTVFSNIDIAGILGLDGLSGNYKNAVFMLLDSDGRILYRHSGGSDFLKNAETVLPDNIILFNEAGYDPQKVEHYEKRSETLGWTLHAFIEKKELYADSALIHRNLLIVFAMFFLFSLVLAVLLARGISKPVTALSKICNTEPVEAVVWDYVNGTELKKIVHNISKMSHRNTLLATQVHSYREGIRNNFFRKLLEGEIISPEEIGMIREDVNPLFEYTHYAVAVLRLIHSGEEAETEQDIWAIGRSVISLLRFLERNPRENMYFCKTDFDEITLIGCGNTEEIRESVTEYLRGIPENFNENGYRTCWGVGSVVGNTDQIFVSNFNAVQRLNNLDCEENKKDSVLSADTGWDWQNIQYSLEDEQRLLNALSQGNQNTSQLVLQDIFSKNAASAKKSKNRMGVFVAALSNTVIRAENMVATENSREKINLYLWQMKNVGDLVALARYMDVIAELFSEIVNHRNASRQQRLITKIYELIRDTYRNPQLCLNSISEHFGLTESYVSSFFKQATGKNISQYIEQVRMKKTVELLGKGGRSTTQIAEDVGYSNMNTFYKAFKRHYGINPKAYKEKLFKEQKEGG